MPTQYKKNPNEDTAYFDGHKVNLIAVPAGTLQLPIHPTSDSGYVVDNNGKKHRVLMATFISGTVDYKSSPTADSAYVTINGQKVKVRLAVKENGTLTLSDKPNVDKGYVVGDDSEKHRVTLINTPTGTLELPNNETDDSAYIIDGNGNKIKVRMFALLSGGYVEVTVKGTSPLSLPDAVADSLSYVKAFGGTEQGGIPSDYTLLNGVANGSNTYIDTGITPAVDDVEIELRVKPSGGSWYMLQSRASGGPIWGISGSSTGSTILLGWAGTGTLLSSAITRDPTHIYYVKATVKNGNATLYVKDETAGTEDTKTTTYTSAVPSLPFWLYGNQNSDRVASGNTVYMARIKVGGVTVMDYVPSLNPSMVVGFYDKITGNFKVSDAGTLTADQTIVPTPTTPIDIWCNNGVLKARHQSGLPLGYTLLDYIESDRTQYIDTGFIADNTTGFYIDAQKTTDNSADSVVYGSRASTNARCWLDIDHSGTTEYEGRVLFGWGNYTQAGGTDVDNRVAVYLNRFTGSFNYNNTRKVFIDNIERPWYNQQLEDTLPTQTGSIYMFGGNTAGSFSVPWYGRIYNFKITQNSNLVHNFIPAKNSSNIIGMYDTVSGQFFTNAGTGDFIAGTAVSDPVEIYTDGTVETIKDSLNNIAIAEMLLKVGDYQDEQEIISGAVTRNVGVMVLDGTEGWQLATATDLVQFYTPSTQGVVANSVSLTSTIAPYGCTAATRTQYDFGCYSGGSGNLCFQMKGSATLTTTTAWTQYLADQYAAGTPVIVIYPLATPTTESVAGQTLQVQAGDNTLEITQASLNGLELEAEYKKNA